MASLNRVLIMGNLGQDPELRYTQSQVAVVTLNIATTEFWTKDGQRQEQTEWHRVIVWNRQAENCAKYLSKGRSVFVEGRLQTRSWDDKNGQKRYTTEITASNIQFLPSAGNSTQTTAQTNQSVSAKSESQPNYFPETHGTPPQNTNSRDNAVSGLDDIPF